MRKAEMSSYSNACQKGGCTLGLIAKQLAHKDGDPMKVHLKATTKATTPHLVDIRVNRSMGEESEDTSSSDGGSSVVTVWECEDSNVY